MKISQLLSAPNQLTLLRLIFIPFIIINIVDNNHRWALILLVIAALGVILVLGLFAGSCWERNRWKMATDPAGHTKTMRP